MALSIFDSKSHQPTTLDLSIKLGDNFSLWKKIVEHMHSNYMHVMEEWTFSGEKYGWSLRLCIKNRRIIYLIPCDHSIKIGMVLGQKAFDQVTDLDLPQHLEELILSAPKYGEGYGFRFDLEFKSWVEEIYKLIELKVKN